jgi:pSer/pThr/pTyr-binding forkhead associated (FHA) protein
MEPNFGKLVVAQMGSPLQEYALNKASITLGRALSADIPLLDARLSRNHARLECGTSGCTIVDLGSANGTRLNGRRVEKAELSPGDIISIGNTSLRYEFASLPDDLEMIRIDTDADLDLTLQQESLPVMINAANIPRLAACTAECVWEVSLENVDTLTLGRADDNQLVIDSAKVSRHHARLLRKGDLFVLRDLDSTNGTWLRGRQVDEVILQAGDVLRLGNAKIVYKSGFSSEALTIPVDNQAEMPARRPVVFVPGLMSSPYSSTRKFTASRPNRSWRRAESLTRF